MRSAEITTTPEKYIKDKPHGFNLGFLETLKNPFGIFDKKIKLWSSQRYVEAALLHKQELAEHRPHILNELKPDLKSFLDEYAALLPVVSYEYGTSGMKNGYSQTMTQIAQHHLQEQELKGLPTERALMEVEVAETIEAWMQTPDLPVGSKIVSVSPRGSQAEGYPGQNKKNYIFVNVFEKVADGFVFQQYRSYDTLDQTFQLQSGLEKKLGGARHYAAKIPQQRNDLHAIASLVTLRPETTFYDLESVIYTNKKSWAVDVDTELPKLDWAAYSAISNQAVEFCLEQFVALTNDLKFSIEAEEHFTLLITTVKESLIKWVETHALNYDSKQPDHEVDLNQILSVWKARCAHADGEKLDDSQKGLLTTFKKATALDASLPLKSLSSWAHCIVGSPASLLKLQNADMMQALQTNQFNQAQIAELIGKDRAALWHQGTCVRCGDRSMVGECSICMKCELELGGQLPADTMSNAQSQFLDSLSFEDKNKGKELFDKFSKLVLRKTVSFEQLINNDFVNPSAITKQSVAKGRGAPANDDLEPYMNRILFAHNGLEELERIVFELSTKNNEKEHKNNSAKKAMLITQASSKTGLVA